MSRWLRWRVRVDRVVAAVLLVPAVPVVALAALAVRRHDGGPALIRVTRVGRGGAPFGMWKVRTMAAAGPGGLAPGDPVAGRDDPRVTPVGRLLRRARVDELPQLWNIARGQMALVGPRPEDPAYVDPADPAWEQVLRAPPGVAGVTQALVHRWEAEVVAAGGAEAYRRTVLPVKLAMDGWYVRSACPSVDLCALRALLGTRRPAAVRRLLDRVVAGGVAGAAAIGDG